jgi:hypothetical protein
MSGSLTNADSTTHIKIVIVALLAAMVVIWVGIAGRTSTAVSEGPRYEKSSFDTRMSMS